MHRYNTFVNPVSSLKRLGSLLLLLCVSVAPYSVKKVLYCSKSESVCALSQAHRVPLVWFPKGEFCLPSFFPAHLSRETCSPHNVSKYFSALQNFSREVNWNSTILISAKYRIENPKIVCSFWSTADVTVSNLHSWLVLCLGRLDILLFFLALSFPHCSTEIVRDCWLRSFIRYPNELKVWKFIVSVKKLDFAVSIPFHVDLTADCTSCWNLFREHIQWTDKIPRITVQVSNKATTKGWQACHS